MDRPEAFYFYGNRDLYIHNEATGLLTQLPGCCAVWHFHTLGLGAQRFPEKLVRWLEETLEERTSVTPNGNDRPRGMLLLTASEADGFGSLLRVLRERPRWEEKTFKNPQNGHEVSLFTLVRKGK